MSTQNIAFTYSFAAGSTEGAAISGIDKGGFTTNVNVSAMSKRVALRTTSTSDQTATLNSTAKDKLYPNAAATPTEADFNMQVFAGWSASGNRISGSVKFGSTTIYSYEHQSNMLGPYELPKANTGNKSQAVISSKQNTAISLVARSTKGAGAGYVSGSITLYFTRYDFNATAGTGIASASVANTVVRSDKNTAKQGFNGDTMRYTCTLSSGYTFDGWYDGNTKVSSSQTYDYTVNGADKTLTAKATAPTTKTLKVKYCGANIVNQQVTGTVNITHGGSTIASLSSGTKTLRCKGKIAQSNIVVGSKTLQCNGKYMQDDVTVTIT